MKKIFYLLILSVIACIITGGCASISTYLVGTPLIGAITNNKEVSRVMKETITVSGTYEVSYFIPTNHLSTPSDIALNSSGEIFVSLVRGKGIAKVTSAGDVSLWANTENVGSYSLAIDSADNVYSYFFPGGSIYKISPDGSVTALFKDKTELKCYNESSITVNPANNELYIVRNDEVTGYATLYKMVGSGLVTVLDRLSYVQVMAFSREGRLFLGMDYEIKELNLNNLLLTTITRLPENRSVNHHGLALDVSGNIYAATKNKLYKIGVDGVIKYLACGFYDLEGIVVSSDNIIYGVDRQTCALYRISESSRLAEYLVPPSYISTPQALAFNSEGKLVITEDEAGAYGVYSGSGAFESYTSAIVYQPPLAGLAIDSGDNIYISESAPGFSDRLVRFGKDGSSTVVSTQLQKPSGLAFYNNELYIAEFDAGSISKMTASGVIDTYVSGLTHPQTIAFDNSGNLYVCAGAAELNDSSVYIEKIATDKTITRFASITDLSYIQYDNSNNYLLASVSTGDVYKILPDGTSSVFISGMQSPMGIAFDASGNIYIADDVVDAVYKFKK